MAWGLIDLVIFTYSSVDYVFVPTELIYDGAPKQERNQLVQEAESGKQKILELDSNLRSTHTFTVKNLPEADRVIGAVTYRGYNTLSTLINASMRMQMNTVTVKPPGTGFGSGFLCRYTSPSLFIPVSRIGSTETYHSGGPPLKFREEL